MMRCCSSSLVAFTAISSILSAAFTNAVPLSTEQLLKRASVITNDPSEATATAFDYVIVGGGLAGLVVANRLTEDTNTRVLVIESGQDTRGDPNIRSFDTYGQVFGNKTINWVFTSSSGRTISAGRGVGGSTSINGGAITRGDVVQLDNIGKLGNDGWDYSSLLTYIKKSETFARPSQAQVDAGAQYNESAHGFSGPVSIRFGEVQGSSSSNRKRFYTGPYQRSFGQSIKTALGTEQVADLSAGKTNGWAYTTDSMLPGGGNLRSSSAIAYLSPIENTRTNLVVLTTWRGWKLTWASGTGTPRATGVVIQQSNGGTTYTVKANKEVIVAAGAIRSPVFLQHSGIGDPSHLASINVPLKVNLPGVGKNLNEQTMSVLGAAPKNGVDFGGVGPSNFVAQPSIRQLFSNASAVRSSIEAQFGTWAQAAVDAGAAVNTQGLIAQWRLQTSALFDSNVGAVEYFVDSGYPNNGFGVDLWPLLPYSRGSVKASSASTFGRSLIDARYFSVPFDMDMQVQGCRGVRRVFQTAPVSDLFANGETQPGFDVSQGGIPDGPNKGAYARWQTWIAQNFGSVSHPIGTCALAPRENGGVVSPVFTVYGTANVRVVDASVLPQQISAHLSNTIYGIAERAADAIRQGS
ncbi:hypothetical protein V8E36_001249 [Tilletia maclaganii]